MTDNTGDAIGRDQIVHGDVVGQDKVSGDKIVNEQNVYGDLHIHHAPAEPAAPPVDFAAVEQRYRDQVVKHYNKLALTGLPERDPGLHEISLEQIFIKLNIELPQPTATGFLGIDGKYYPSGSYYGVDGEYHPPNSYYDVNAGKYQLSPDIMKDNQYKRERRLAEMTRRRPEPITLSVADALRRHPHLTIIGGPGSGKTTLTRWLAVIFARGEQAKPENLGASLADDRLPIVLELRRFAERFVSLSQQPAVPDLAAEIASFISQHTYYPGTPAVFIQQALADGHCLLLLDGLDEIADLGACQTLSEAVQAFLQHTNQGYRQNLLLVTSRPHGYHSISLSAFQECEVKPFTKEDVARFIRHWYATAYPNQEQTEAGDLIDAIQANDRVGELATNPLLCTIIAIVYRNNRVLPNRRVELYLKCCEALLDTWERNKAIKQSGLIGGYDWQTKLELLAPVAYWLHGETERLAAPEDDFVTQLAQVLRARQLGDPAQAEQTARQFIKVIRDRSGLLQGRGDGTLEFTHRTFQEYLAARHIAAQPYPDYIDWVMVHLHEAWWREVHLLVIGYLGSSSATADKATALLQAILAYIPPPWPWLRSYSLTALTPRWLLRLVERTENANRLTKWGVQVIRLVVLLPHLPSLFVAWLWPRWQLARRLAWLLDREWAFVALGYLDCTPVGVRPTLSQPLLERAERMLTQYLYDQAYAGDFAENGGQLLRTLRLARRELALSPTLPLTALHDPERSVRAAAAEALGQVGQADPAIIQALLTALHDPNESVRNATAQTLNQLSQADPAVIQALLTALHDTEPFVQVVAVAVLGQVGQADSAIIQALLTALHDTEPLVQVAVAAALSQLGQAAPAIVATWLTTLHDSEGSVRYAAIWALSQLGQGDPAVITALLAALHDPEWFVQVAAAEALGHLGQPDPTVITALLTALQDPEEYIRAAAARTLGQLKVIEKQLLYQLLVGLNRRMYVLDDDERQSALGAIDKQLEGQPLPGYYWTPIREQIERSRRLNQFRWWAMVVCIVVLVALVVVYLSARLDADSLLVRFGAAVALITGLAAGIAQVLGWTLRNPYEKRES
ncbi:MAG: HEAT repeat domain-containing protein [Caldilineaceae bacterium]